MPESFTQLLKPQDFSSFASIQPLEPRRMLAANSYTQVNLTSDGSVAAAHTDSHLVNPWGMLITPHGFEVADADTGFITGYDGTGKNAGPSVAVPGPSSTQGVPTGIVQNSNAGKFLVAGQAASYITVTENGTIDAWNASSTKNTVHVVVNKSSSGALYKGAAMATLNGNPLLYAANFAAGTIDVFNSSFAATKVSGGFKDATLPKGFSPFNIQNIKGNLWVEYATH